MTTHNKRPEEFGCCSNAIDAASWDTNHVPGHSRPLQNDRAEIVGDGVIIHDMSDKALVGGLQ